MDVGVPVVVAVVTVSVIAVAVVAVARTGELRRGLAERRALVQPQQVGGGQHRAERGEHRQHTEQREAETTEGQAFTVQRVPGAQDRGELPPESGQTGQTQRGHRTEAKDPAQLGHLLQHAAQTPDLERVVTLLHRAGEEEEHAGDQTVGHHAEQRCVDAERRQRADTEHHEAHVGHRRERDQALHVGLREASEGAVDDADDGQHPDHRGPLHRRLRQERDGDAHETVGAQFQQDRGQDHRTLRGRLRVGVGQPRVEREHRHLHGEADEHAGEDPDGDVLRHIDAVLDEVRDREAHALGLVEEREERHQHQRRPEHRVEEELQRRVLAVLATPHADHEVHRQQHHFEEHEEQDEVLGDEGAGHTGLQHQHQDEECLRVTRRRHVVPRVDHHEHGDDHRQEVQRQADAVEADGVPALDDRDPLRVGEELQLLRLVVVELGERVHAHAQRGHRREHRHLLVQQFLCLGDEEHHQHTGQRQECAEAQQPVLVAEDVHGRCAP